MDGVGTGRVRDFLSFIILSSIKTKSIHGNSQYTNITVLQNYRSLINHKHRIYVEEVLIHIFRHTVCIYYIYNIRILRNENYLLLTMTNKTTPGITQKQETPYFLVVL